MTSPRPCSFLCLQGQGGGKPSLTLWWVGVNKHLCLVHKWRSLKRRGCWSALPTQALLTLGRMCSSSPFSRRHSTCCVLSPPMPKLSACRGEKSSRQICGQEVVWAQGHHQHGPPLSIQSLTKCHHVRSLFYESSLVKSHLKQTPIWSNITVRKPIAVSLS